jgi:hypothetical protein
MYYERQRSTQYNYGERKNGERKDRYETKFIYQNDDIGLKNQVNEFNIDQFGSAINNANIRRDALPKEEKKIEQKVEPKRKSKSRSPQPQPNPRFRNRSKSKSRSPSPIKKRSPSPISNSKRKSVSRSPSPSPRKKQKSRSRSPSPKKRNSRSRSRSRSISRSASRSRSRSRRSTRSPSVRRSREKSPDKPDTIESVSGAINKNKEELIGLLKKLEDLTTQQETMKNIKYYFLDRDQKQKCDTKLPQNQSTLFGNATNYSISCSGLNSYFKEPLPYSMELKHIINGFMYSRKGRVLMDDEFAITLRKSLTVEERKLPRGVYLFEIQVYPALPKESSFAIDQFPRDLVKEIKIEEKFTRETFTLLTYNPNVALNSAAIGDYCTNTLIIHELTSDIRAISISEICSSYDSLGVLLIEDQLNISIKKIEEKLEINVLDLNNPKEDQFSTRKVKVIWTELSKKL